MPAQSTGTQQVHLRVPGTLETRPEQSLLVQDSSFFARFSGERVLFLIQYRDLPTREQLAKHLGALHIDFTIVAYVPDKTWLVSLPVSPYLSDFFSTQRSIHWVSIFSEHNKHLPFPQLFSSHSSSTASPSEPIELRAELVPHLSQDLVSNVLIPQWLLELRQVAPHLLKLSASSSRFVSALCTSLEAATMVVESLRKSPAVVWIESHRPRVLMNAFAHGVTQSGDQDSSPLWDLGYDGSGQVVALADSGLDYYRCFFADPDGAPFDTFVFSPEVVAPNQGSQLTGYWAYMDKFEDPSGHGTHVAGSIAGNANNSTFADELSQYNGMAFNARLLVTDIGCQTSGGCCCFSDEYCSSRCPNNLCAESPGETYEPDNLAEFLFPFSYENGARIHSNSWGELPSDGSYMLQSQSIDTFIYDNPDMLILFAASNDGQSGLYTISPEGSSKNSLTVGAAMTTNQGWITSANYTNYTAAIQRAQTTLCNAGYPDCLSFTTTADCCSSPAACAFLNLTDPDCFASQCCPAYFANLYQTNPDLYSQDNMASFSSRGFTKDGRIKPDISAPGQRIISSNSQGTANQVQCGAVPAQSELIQKSGTSMATPVTAGNAAIVRQFLQETRNISDPAASTMKALLINSGAALEGLLDLTGKGYYQPLGSLPNPWSTPVPSPYEGFGRVQLESTLLAPFLSIYEGTLQAATNTTVASRHKICVQAKGITSTSFIKVTLVWTDVPSTPAVLKNLVNDLDLTVIHNYDTFLGNARFAANGAAIADSTNNVEQIYLPLTQNGFYSVFVDSAVLTTSNQSFSLVISASQSIVQAKDTNCLDLPLNRNESAFWTIGNTIGVSVGISLIFFFFATLLLLFLLRSRNLYYMSTQNDVNTVPYTTL